MLALRGKAKIGNMLHVIVGPETELFSDIHGAAVMDITPLLMDMDGADHVFLTLTQCRSERTTAKRLEGTDMPHISSFSGASNMPGVEANESREFYQETNKSSDDAEEAVHEAAPSPKLVKGHCEYCDQDMELLEIPGFKICRVCAQIELGRLKQDTGE